MVNSKLNNKVEYSKPHLRILLTLSISMVGTMTTWFSMTAVLPDLIKLWELTATEGSFFTIMVQAGFVIGCLLSAFINLPDRIQPPVLFFWSACIAGVSTILTAIIVHTLTGALIMRFITGIALAGVYGPGIKLLSTWFRERRGMALGVLVGALTLGSAFPHLFRGVGTASWEVVLIITGTTSIIAGLLVRFFVYVGPYPLPAGKFEPMALPRLLKHRPVRLANYGYFGHMWELYAMWSWFGIFAAKSLESSGMNSEPTLSSILTFLVIASGFFGSWIGGILSDRIGRERLTLWSLSISGSITLLIGLIYGRSPWLLVILGIIWGISIIADSAQFSALITEHADQRYVGTALTFQLAIGFALTMFVIWIIPFLESVIGWRFVFLILLPGPIGGFIAMHRLYNMKHSKQDIKEGESL
ncbi:MFS transporter [Bacillus sp. M6-12]|uniref:MFS transporter n=1 Tax=Bacillus sp. M6-12 TaxID=2054166 RepID=UPI000C79324B|nr:MFS transporter [Bacillus sp. M6-12]PLS17473.1 MFS transporter [Bacillus sp. M6-12]